VLSRMTTGKKILASFGVAFLAMVAVGVTAWLGARELAAQLEDVAAVTLPTVDATWTVREAQTDAARALSQLALRRSDEQMRRNARADFEAAIARIAEGIVAYEAIPHSDDALVLWRDGKTKLDTWQTRAAEVMRHLDERERLLGAGQATDSPELAAVDARAWAAFMNARSARRPCADALEAVREQARKDAGVARDRGHAVAARTVTTILVSTLVAGLLLAALAVFLGRKVGGNISALVREAGRLRDAVRQGKLDVRGDPAAIEAEFRPIVAGINETMEAFARPIEVTADYVTRISKGDIPPKITDRYEGDFNRIIGALNRCIDAVGALVADAGALAKAGVEGRLATRADASRHEGDFRKVVQGVNDTLDAVVGPLTVAAKAVDDIARGAIPPPIAADYRGDFAKIRDNLNRCIAAVNALVSDATTLARAGVDGRLATRADPSRHQGDFRKIVQGVNDTLDAVVGPLNVAARTVERISNGDIPEKITQQYQGDFAPVRDNLNTCIDAVTALVADADRLVAAAIAGQLSTRADASKHQGDFRKIVDGVNRTLDAVIAPVTEAGSALDRLARRDLRARVTGQFQGDHARIQQAVNSTAEALGEAIGQVAAAVEQVSSAATQIAASSQAVASGASEQASSLEETSSSIDSVSGMTRAATDHAQQANVLAQNARTAATEGAAAVEQMQGAMSRIKASSEGTSQIIKDVSDIAFQTNLLALNAAVEAARAGEAGRGFAVVAEEVRSLALRAKEAATKTEELIRQSVKEASEGEQTAKHVAGKLGEIVGGISKVTAIVSEIAASAQEQAAGIGQVNKAVAEMDKVTQQNAASAEESSAAASELSGQAEELAAMVGSFQLDRAAGTGQRALPARARAALSAGRAAPPSAASLGAPRNGRARAAVELPVAALAAELFPMEQEGDVKDF